MRQRGGFIPRGAVVAPVEARALRTIGTRARRGRCRGRAI